MHLIRADCPGFGDIHPRARLFHVFGGSAGGPCQPDGGNLAPHIGRAIVHPGSHLGLGRQAPQLPSPRLGDDRHEEGGIGAPCRQPKLRLPALGHRIADPHRPARPVHGKGQLDNGLVHPGLEHHPLQELKLQRVVGLGEVEAHRSGSIPKGFPLPKGSGQQCCLVLGPLPAADQALRMAFKPSLELLRSDLGPGPLDQGQQGDRPGLQTCNRQLAFAQQHHPCR